MVHPPLTHVEVRVLGSLIEKEVTTPDTYPLTLSALAAACNQSSNRDPVMRLEEGVVSEAVVALRRRNLLRAMQPAGSRVTKFSHLLADALDLDARELAVLGVLMLRGAQTPGELHARTARLAEFADIADLETTLEALIARDPEPLVVRHPRRPGQKEVRYGHLLGGQPAAPDEAEPRDAPGALGAPGAPANDDRVAALERTVGELRAELAALRAQFVEFRAQFQ
jgi:uncharacterized protein YceH (UPF0502 family)